MLSGGRFKGNVVITTLITDYFGSDTLAHIHAGLAIYVGVQFLLRTRRASFIALNCVFVAELCNEVMDRIVYQSWRWEDTSIDILATFFWPVILYAVSRYRRQRWAVDQARNAKIERWFQSHYRHLRPNRASAVPLSAARRQPVVA